MLKRAAFVVMIGLGAFACGSTDESSPDDAGSDAAAEGGRPNGIDGSVVTFDGGSDAGNDADVVTDGDAGDAGDGSADVDGGDDGGQGDGGVADGGDDTDAAADAVASDGGDDGGDGGGCSTTTPAEVVVPGAGTNLLLRGVVVTPDQVFTGEVLITGDTITCVAEQCPGGDTIVDTHGIIFPGLIDAHNHILFDAFDETDWSPTMSYGNHNQWTNEARYGAMVDAKQYINGEGSSPVDYGCELDKFGELKGLVAGTTSIVGAANPANRGCFGSLARTIDQSPNGLGDDTMQVATLFPATAAADGVCSNFSSGKTDAYLIHVAEGVDSTALAEFGKLGTVTTTDSCLYDPKTTIVHGTALGDVELTVLGQQAMSLVWSPRSNVFLYGGGTDLTRTTNIPLALAKGINIALGPDWSIGGSQNLLDELRFANHVDDTVWGDILSAKMLVQMVTTNAAKAIGRAAVLGSLAAGKKADVMVVGGDTCRPYDALLAATPRDVRLVLVGGKVLYGDAALKSLGPPSPGCEDLGICGVDKFACVASTSNTATDKFGQTFSQIQSTLSDALTQYDALDLSVWKFSPITPLVRCP